MQVSWQPGLTLDVIEKEIVLKALRYYHGNRAQTADSLGISIKTLYNKLQSYGVADDGPGIQRDAEEIERKRQEGLQPKTGPNLESSDQITKKQSMSV